MGCQKSEIPDGTPVVDTYDFAAMESDSAPKMLLFTSISPQWYKHKVDYLAGMGVKGAMMHGMMHSWDSDVWALPNTFVPDASE